MLDHIALFLKHLTTEPGVYRMLDTEGQVLYVGKAKNLKKRVSSYFKTDLSSPKNRALVQQIHTIDVSVTRSETEALLLESSLIKSLRPKYNVLMRDDKTYPFLVISKHAFPRISVMRTKHKPQSGEYFGPYPSATAVRDTMQLLQKIFRIRSCSDVFFHARTRPCLQYQIKRCSAPCVQYISPEEYQQALAGARLFLQGKNQQILEVISARIQQAIQELAFEEASVLRDQMKQLRLIQEQQGVVQSAGDADVIAIEARPGFACIQHVCVRDGHILSDESFFPLVPETAWDGENEALWQHVFGVFIAHYYLDRPERIPALIVTQHPVEDQVALQNILSEQRKSMCLIQARPRGSNAKWLDFAIHNLHRSIEEHHTSRAMMRERYQDLACFLHLHAIQRMICFDISHTQGQSTVASCVVFDENGPLKRAYRRFNITDVTPGDDYASMEQALRRYFKRTIESNAFLPDVVVIDGGYGQVSVARRVLDDFCLTDLKVLGISKGPTRKAGWENLWIDDAKQETTWPSDSPALHLVQHIRDEAHRFAISTHRRQRGKESFTSSLKNIPGVGKKRHQALLLRFGGLRELAHASIDEIAKVDGIAHDLATRIYQHFHP